MHGDTHLVWESLALILTDSGMTVVPTHTLDSCPFDILFLHGGFGAWAVMGRDGARFTAAGKAMVRTARREVERKARRAGR